MKVQYYIILVLIFAILVSVFAISNSAPVSINFLFWHYTISQALVILLSAVAGALAIGIVGLLGQIRGNLRTRALNSKLKELQKENEEMLKKIQDFEQHDQYAAGYELNNEEKNNDGNPTNN